MVATHEPIPERDARRTWLVTSAAATTPLLVVAALLVVGMVMELTARTELVRSQLLPPSVGSGSRDLELQLARLEAFVQREGHPDCVFLGSSLVLTGLDPEVFAAAFERRSGRRIRCFNLGVPGMSASDVGALAGIVAADHRPSLVVYGATFRDFGARATGPGLAELPWVRHSESRIACAFRMTSSRHDAMTAR